MPIGLTIGAPQDVLAMIAILKPSPGPTDPLAMPMVGVSCAACHAGQLRYKGKNLPIVVGTPNLFNIDSFYQELFQSAAATVQSPAKLETFLKDLGKRGAASEIAKILVSSFDRTKQSPSHVANPEEGAFVKRIQELLQGVGNAGKLESPDAKIAYRLLIRRFEFLNAYGACTQAASR